LTTPGQFFEASFLAILEHGSTRGVLNDILPPTLSNCLSKMANVLVIDDEPVTRMVVCAVLESAGHTVCEAADGNGGLAMFHANSPDLVITDILMPGKDGIETIRDLRAINPEIKIIALSGDVQFDGPGILKAARLLGANEVIEKPFGNDELLRIVEQMLACRA
jgi:CheY-like chemotaxis protein